MHLRSYPKLLRSELHLDATGVPAPSQRSQQEALMRRMSSKQSHISTSRIPLAFISTNTLCYSASGTSLQLPLPAASRYCVPPEPCRSAAEDADAPPNVWTVIRPGHVREKIAMFASEGTRTNETDGGPTACTDAGAPTGPLRAAKAKGSWEENSAAKRRRRSSNNRNQSEQQQRKLKAKPRSAEPPGGGQAAAEEQQKISVVEMVAFLELRARQLQPSLKPLLNLQRSSTTITLSKTAPPELREGEEPEVVRVSEMVARLESERLRSAEAGLSRSNSLKRRVGRVLLAAGRRSPAPAAPSHTPAPPDAQSGSDDPVRAEPPPTGKPEEEEPQPGLLFLSADRPESQPRPPHYRTSFYLEPALPGTSQQPEKAGGSPPLGRSASASQDFLRVRQRLQRLLAPQSYLLLLPHHLLVKLLLLLPTHSLAALKCSCSYFKFVIENYGVRPADSLWVSDPRYRDDPCKQCKRRYRPGDVSLCRWHHKPYCQALPYGPGYWMCCHGAQRDAPGCNVGLHDNRWVPAFHSINAPIYRRNYIREGGVV